MGGNSALFYNKFSVFYPLINIFLKGQKKVLFNEINTLPEGALLEIGVGNGTNLQHYQKHKVIGIDTSIAMLNTARKHNCGNFELLQMDGKALLFDDERFDYIILSHVLAVVDDPEKLMEEVWRVLKPDAKVFILNHFTPDNWLKYIDHAFSVFSRWFYFKSVFQIHNITAIKKFTLLKEIRFGSASYFKLLIYQKK